MNEGNRIREIRNKLNMSLEVFGEKVGVTRAAMSNIERGQRNLTPQMAKSICREFNVSYDWLMSGTGEMFQGVPQSVLDEIFRIYDCDDLDKIIITEYLKLSPDDRQIFRNYIRRVIAPSDPADS